MRRDPRAFLWDALSAAEAIQGFVKGRDAHQYAADELLHSAVERKFEIISEALGQLAKVDASLAAQLPRLAQIVAFRNVLIPVITVIGLQVGSLLGGAVLVEIVFSWPGMGELIINGITQRDYPVVQASVLVVAMIFIVINIIVDVLYAVVDPRVRHGL